MVLPSFAGSTTTAYTGIAVLNTMSTNDKISFFMN